MKLRFKMGTALLAGAMVLSLFTGCGSQKETDKSEPEASVEQEDDSQKSEAKEDKADDTTNDKTEDKATEAPAEAPAETDASALSLKDAYADMFPVGVACSSWQLSDPDTLKAINKDYSSITAENEMKPDYLLDQQASQESDDGMPVINTENLDNLLKLAEDAGLKMRGHTLVWHSQTPEWLFYKDFDTSKDRAGRKVMLKRMESYIKQVMTFCQEKHPGVVYAWDVVNEAINDDEYRLDSPWYETVGEDYIEKAFEYARKYADKDVKLFYNDYSCTVPTKREIIYDMVSKLHEKGLIDGVGMQSHYDMQYFGIGGIENTIYTLSQIEGLEIQLTELDMHNNDNSEESMQSEAENYKQLFELLVELDSSGTANITNVTFWGLNDGCTWLTGFKGEDSYPLLYDAAGEAKPSYFSVYNAAGTAK